MRYDGVLSITVVGCLCSRSQSLDEQALFAAVKCSVGYIERLWQCWRRFSCCALNAAIKHIPIRAIQANDPQEGR
jgi:hypothetical protein